MISSYYNFWDYWQLYHKVTFDGVRRLIIINPGETEIDVQRDIYSAWKEWSLLEQNTKYLQALNTVGGEPTVGDQSLDTTFFLINGWRIKPQPGSYTLNLIGNIFEVDGQEIFVPADVNPFFPNNININTNTSVIVRRINVDTGEGGEGLTPEEKESLFNIENRVIEIENIVSNTDTSPLTATLVESEEEKLNDIYEKVRELWKIHGLDSTNPMTVNKQGRDVADIKQIFEKIGDDIKVTRDD